MTVGVTLEVKRTEYDEGRTDEIPFYVAGTDTGDASGGTMDFNIHFNPASRRQAQPFVIITHVSFNATVANPGNGYLITQTGTYERTADHFSSIPILIATVPQNGPGTSLWGGYFTGAVPVGRVHSGTTGRIQFRFENVNTAVVNVYVAGILTYRPDLASYDRRA